VELLRSFRFRVINDDAQVHSGRCGICGAPAVFDSWLGINICPACGAHETTLGWQKRRLGGMQLAV
jgi:hypothetical protein